MGDDRLTRRNNELMMKNDKLMMGNHEETEI